MGMYTELFFRAELKKDAPPELIGWLAFAFDTEASWGLIEPFDSHAFFESKRWTSVFGSSSAYHPYGESNFYLGDGIRPASFSVQASLKNCGSEIEDFTDWIAPWLDHREGDFLGYSLHEESRVDAYGGEAATDQPQLIFMPKL